MAQLPTPQSPVVTTEKISVEFSQNSPLNFSKLRQFNEVVFWERIEVPNIVPTDADAFVTLSVQDRVDNLAVIGFKDPDLWWFVSTANGIGLPPLHMQPGDRFRIPSPAVLKNILRGR